MPSRKKAKGKARKAAKEAKAKEKEKESRAVVADQVQEQEESLESQMQLLTVNAASTELCRHGLVPLSAGEEKIIVDFINAFIAAFNSQDQARKAFLTAYNKFINAYLAVFVSFIARGDMMEAFTTACLATKDEYADVYDSE